VFVCVRADVVCLVVFVLRACVQSPGHCGGLGFVGQDIEFVCGRFVLVYDLIFFSSSRSPYLFWKTSYNSACVMLHEQFIFIDSSRCAGPFGAYRGLVAGVFPSIASQATTLQTRRHATYARLPPSTRLPPPFSHFPSKFFPCSAFAIYVIYVLSPSKRRERVIGH